MTGKFAVAKEVLNSNEMECLGYMFLNSEVPNSAIDWESAAADVGLTNVNSLKNKISAIRKKLAAKMGDSGAADIKTTAAATPVKPAAKGRKRKTADDEEVKPPKTPAKKSKAEASLATPDSAKDAGKGKGSASPIKQEVEA